MYWQSVNESYTVCQCSGHNSHCVHQRDNGSSNNYVNDMEKENINFGSPGKHDGEISLYGSSSPTSTSRCAMICSPTSKTRQSLAEFDLNSQDSGYGASFTEKENIYMNFSTKTIENSRPVHRKRCPSSLFGSFSSVESYMDDGFLELPTEMEKMSDENELPCSFNNLLQGSIKSISCSSQSSHRTTFRRSISLKEPSVSNSARARCLFGLPGVELALDSRAFKRPEPPTDIVSPVNSKRYKYTPMKTSPAVERPKVMRSISATEESIMSAVQRSSTDPDLIGDYSKPFILPLVSGRHQDLKSISSTTLAELMRGQYDHAVASYKIIDCRYPYEFIGGHISGALNLYSKGQILSELVDCKSGTPVVEPDLPKRHILVFHCEFSSERGPNLSRFLRNLDRTRNNDAYPALHYPEIYLLDGGYKGFYEQFSDLCEPKAYKPMLDPAHENDLRHFRAKSKTWNSDSRSRSQVRSSFKRLGFQ